MLGAQKLVLLARSVFSKGAVPVGEGVRGAGDERCARGDTAAVIADVQSPGGLPPRAQAEKEVVGGRGEDSVERSQVQTIPMY